MVNKLAAILRVADALDRTHNQTLRNPTYNIRADRLQIEVASTGEYDAEKRALSIKAQMFEQVYGKTVVLKTIRMQE